jgi:hypothetical protein
MSGLATGNLLGQALSSDSSPAAMIDRMVRHVGVIALNCDSYRIKDRDPGHNYTAETRALADHPKDSYRFWKR